MGRHKKNTIREFFTYDSATNKSTCRIATCEAKITGNHAGNLLRHVERSHKQVFENWKLKKKESSDSENDSDNSSRKSKKVRGQMSIDEFVNVRRKKINVEISANDILNACTELVSLNGRPLALLEDSGFQKIIKPLLVGLNNEITINIDNVKRNIVQAANEGRKNLNDELKGKLLLLKADVATCQDRSVLGINVQYINLTKENKITIRTLGMKEMKEKHTSKYISNIIIDVLKEYNLTVENIYSITTDNGANMLKAVTLLASYNDEIESKTEQVLDPDEVLNQLDNIDEISEEGYIDQLSDTLENEHVAVADMLLSNGNVNSILQGVRCAAHTLQLAIGDSVKDRTIFPLISKVRKVCKKLRTPSVLNIMKKMKLKKPIIECVTRWDSMHDMLQRLLELKGFCEDMSASIPELHISSNEWANVDLIVSALKPAKKGSKAMQSEQLTAGDFLALWMRLKIDTEKIDTIFSKNLVKNMSNRETNLLDSEPFLVAIFLDPRYKIMLTELQIKRARTHLMNTFEIMNIISEKDNKLNDDEKNCSPSSEERDELEIILRNKEKKLASQPIPSTFIHLQTQIEGYWHEPRLDKKDNVFHYWHKKQYEYPDLYEVAVNVIALPTTQVSVERSFSALKFILSPQRTNLSEKMLEDILFLRLNHKFD